VLDTLSPKERVAFCMYHLDGLEQAEIGAILGFTKSYVCKLIKRAESRLEEDA
jgi:RNA polymerase sigma-70 factor, ECF subfamily